MPSATPDRPLLERLQERTAERVIQAKRGPSYNVPLGWYCRPDGEIVKLQADSGNRAYYEDKGYAYLRPNEVREWEENVRPQVLKYQKRRASLINTIRRIAAKNPSTQALVEDTVHDDTDIDELERILGEIGKSTNTPVGVFLNRAERSTPERDEPEPDRDVQGVEVGVGGAEFQQKLERGAPRPGGPRRDATGTLQGTGYDPTTRRANPSA